MQIFTQFLATKGADLSKTSAFLAFYALPYVPDPSSHPSFQDLFTSEWLSELKTRVEKFLSTSVKPARPVLFRAYEILESKPKSKTRSDDDAKYIQTLEKEKDNSAKQCEKLQNEKADLLAVATEMVQALQQTADGRQLSADHLNHLFSLVSKFFPSTTIQKRPPTSTPRGRTGGDRPLPTLDYTRMQRDLLNLSNPDLVARILQALRWRLTRSELGDPRRRVFQTYVTHDILACMPNAPKNLLTILLSSSSPMVVREYAARLVNCLSCECSGRAYLLHNNKLLPLLWVTERADTILRQQALGALQKLSLRRIAQSKMIKIGAVDWILNILGDIDSISKYTLEYGSALLLNLSLRINGRVACEKSNYDVLKVLSDLLECDNLQVRFYTNGTLYSVLARPSLRERAREMGMEDILKYLLKSSDENFANQIEYIMKQLAREDNDDDEDEDGGDSDGEEDVDEDDDNDELVGDEEEAPEILPNDVQPIGESLLCSLYLAKTSEAQREDEEVRKSMDLRKALAHTPRGAPPSSSSGYSPSSPRASSPSPRSSSPSPRSSSPSPSNPTSSNPTRSLRTASAPTHRQQPQQQVLQRPVTPGGFSSTMQAQNVSHTEIKQERVRPKTPGSLTSKELDEMQNAFGTRSKMARTPMAAPAVPLEPLPMIKPRPKKKT